MLDTTTELPSWFIPEKLKLKNFYRYTSWVEDAFFEVRNMNNYDRDKYATQLAAFIELQEKSMKTKVNVGYNTEDGKPDLRERLWDNKIVIEVETEDGETYFVGYKDWTYKIGKGRGGDSWIEPYPYVSNMGFNINKPTVEMNYSDCPDTYPAAEYNKSCPVCNAGFILGSRKKSTYPPVKVDACTFCCQLFKFNDLKSITTIIAEKGSL